MRAGQRRRPIANVKYLSRGYRYQIDEFAWSWFADAGRMFKHGGIRMTYDDPATLGITDDPGQRVRLARMAGPMNTLHLSPFWAAVDTWAGDATALWGTGLDLVNDINPETGKEGVSSHTPGTISSAFEVCRDAWWSIFLWRALFEDNSSLGEMAVGSSIVWPGADSSDGWRIAWPRGKGRPRVEFYANGGWHRAMEVSEAGADIPGTDTDGDGVVDTKSTEGEMIGVTVGILRGRLVIIDLRGGQVSYFQRGSTEDAPMPLQRETTKQGTITVTNLAPPNENGSFHVTWVPIWFPSYVDIGSTVDTPRSLPVNPDFGFIIGGYGVDGGGEAAAETELFDWDDTDPDWAGLLAGEIGLAMRRSSNLYAADWRIRMKPYSLVDTGAGPAITTMATPGLVSLSMYQGAELTDLGAPSVTCNLTTGAGWADRGLVKSLDTQEPSGFGAIEMTLHLDNAFGKVKDIADLHCVTLSEVGWRKYGALVDYWDRSGSYETLWTLEPTLSGPDAEVPCVDLLSWLAIQRFDQGLPVFDSWPLVNAQVWMLQSYGVGPLLYDLEDLYDTDYSATVGTVSHGNWDEPVWQPQRGASPLTLMQEMTVKCGQQAALWAENGVIKSGCRFCGTKRTSADWQTHLDNGWASTGCLAADVVRASNAAGVDVELLTAHDAAQDPDSDGYVTELSRSSNRLDQTAFANYVSVEGKGPMGERHTYTAMDATSIAALNAIIPRIDTAHELHTSARVAARARNLLTELSQDPTYIRGTALLHHEIRRGRVVRIHTDDLNRMSLDGHKFRVTAVAQQIRHDRPYTRFEARQIT